MEIKLIEYLLNQGVAILILAFVSWYVVHPLITAYITSITEITKAMKEDRDNCFKMNTAIMEKLQELEQRVMNEIKDIRR